LLPHGVVHSKQHIYLLIQPFILDIKPHAL
jgi:hypothetical protein